MTLSLPAHGEENWDVKLNAALTQLDTADSTESAARIAADAAKADLVAGTVPDGQIHSSIARDTEVTAAVAAEAAARATAISTAVSNLVNGAPGILDTLGEIATQLATDENAASALATTVAGKQPIDADLTAIAAIDSTVAGALVTDGTGWFRKTYTQLKTALGLVKADVGLGNVDNTADTAKPISTATQTALDLKAPLASPAFTGTPTKGGSALLSAADASGAFAPVDARDTSITNFVVGMLVTSGTTLYRVTTAHAAPFTVAKAAAIGGGGVGVVDATQTVSGRWSFAVMPEIHSLSGDATPINGRSPGDGKTVGTWNLVHDGTVGDLFHLTTGPNTGPSRTVTDGVTTNGSTTVTSATAAFTTGAVLAGVGTDLGKTITGTGIPAGATITAVNSATSVTISAPATASGTGITLALGSGPNVNGCVIAIGVDNGATGIITRNKSTGIGLQVDHLASVASSSSYGLFVQNAAPATAGAAVRIFQSGAATSMKFDGGGAPASSYYLQMSDNGVGGSFLAGQIGADTSSIDWRRTIQTIAPNSSGTPLIRVADEVASNPTELYMTAKTNADNGLQFYKYSGSTTLMWAAKIVQDTTDKNFLKFQMSSGAANKSAETYKTVLTLQGNTGTTGGFAFFNGAPASKWTSLPADATDLASAIALVNDIKNNVIKRHSMAA